MLPSSSVPHLSYDQLRRQAEAFLARYHASKHIPIPIEKIVEFDLSPSEQEAFAKSVEGVKSLIVEIGT